MTAYQSDSADDLTIRSSVVEVAKFSWPYLALSYAELSIVAIGGYLLEGGELTTSALAGALAMPLLTGFGFGLWLVLTWIPNCLVISYLNEKMSDSDA